MAPPAPPCPGFLCPPSNDARSICSAPAFAPPAAPAAPAASRASAPAEKPRMATLGTIAQRDEKDDPDEFFGGDSTAQYK